MASISDSNLLVFLTNSTTPSTPGSLGRNERFVKFTKVFWFKAVLGNEIHFVNILATASEPQSGVDPSSSNEAEKPKIEPLRLPTMEEIQGQDIRNNCTVHSAFSGVMGGGLGLFMGLLLGALDNPLHQEEMTAKQQFVHAAKQMGRRSISSAKTFAVMGFIFSAVECVVEKARAKHDVTNTVVAGCATGGTLSARGGPKAACMGCAGFATFSVLIEKFLDRHD